MQIEKISKHFYNQDTGRVEQGIVYKISYKTLMVMEEDFSYAFAKMLLYARYKGLLAELR